MNAAVNKITSLLFSKNQCAQGERRRGLGAEGAGNEHHGRGEDERQHR